MGAVAFLPLGTALCFAFYMILTRRMATRMHPITLQAYSALAALVVAAPVLLAFDGSDVAALDPSWPDMRVAWLLAGLGVIATLSHVCISFALSLAPASLLAPMQYLEIVGATLFGYLHLQRPARCPDLRRDRLIVGLGALRLPARTSPRSAAPADPAP